MAQGTAITGYRINGLDDYAGILTALANGYFEVEVPMGPVAGAYKNVRLRGDQLTNWLQATAAPTAATNLQRGGPFAVTYYDTSTPGYVAGGSTVADIDEDLICFGARLHVEQGPDGANATYVPVYDVAGPLAINKDGFFGPDTGIPARWVLEGSQEAAAANFRPIVFPMPTPAFALNEVGTFTRAGTAGFYRYKAPAGGTYALPTAVDDANWQQVAPPLSQILYYQPIDVALAQIMASTDTAIQPVLYRILRGSDGTSRKGDVIVQGIAFSPGTVAGEGDAPAQFAQTGKWFDPEAGRWIDAFYDVDTDTVTPAQLTAEQIADVQALVSPVLGRTSSGLVGFSTLDQAFAAPFYVSSIQLNKASLFVTQDAALGDMSLLGTGRSSAELRVEDGVTLLLEDTVSIAEMALSVMGTGVVRAQGGLLTVLNAQIVSLDVDGGEVNLLEGTILGNITGTGILKAYGSSIVPVVIPAGITFIDLRPNAGYNVPSALQTAVVAGTYSTTGSTTGELTSAVPAGSQRGMRFKKGQATYEFMPNDAGTADTWVRTPVDEEAGGGPAGDTLSTLAGTSGAIALDFAGTTVQLLNATGNVSLTTTGRAAVRSVQLVVANTTGSTITVSYESGWRVFGAAMPNSVPAGKQLVLSLQCLGTAATDIKASAVAEV